MPDTCPAALYSAISIQQSAISPRTRASIPPTLVPITFISMHALIPLVFGSILATWAMLALIGGERQRRIEQLPPSDSDPQPAPAPAKANKPPAASKPVR